MYYLTFPTRACSVCGSLSSRLLYRQSFSPMSSGSLLQGYDVVACRDCGFVFADHIPEQYVFDSYYRDMSKYEYQANGGQESAYDLKRFENIVNFLAPFLRDIFVRIVDFGCSNSSLLALLKQRGFEDVVGVDPSPECASIAKRLHGIKVYNNSMAELAGSGKKFDCLILSSVLEHIRNLDELLLFARTVLSEEGLILVDVPDAANFAAWQDAPFQQFNVEHINFFSQNTLNNLMGRYGFRNLMTNHSVCWQTSTTAMQVVTAIFTKDVLPEAPFSPTKDLKSESGVLAYIAQSQRVHNRIQQTIDEVVDSRIPIVVWGVGTHTLRLLETSSLGKANITAYVDSNPHCQGKELNGIAIISPLELIGRDEAILISRNVSMTLRHVPCEFIVANFRS